MGEKIVVAEKIADAGIDLLTESFEVDVAVGAGRDELLDRVADAVGLIVRSATEVDAELLAAAPALRVIGRAGIGVDNIDLEWATDAGILVVNAPAANTISAAEHTMALLLAQARQVPAADASLRAGAWERSRFQGVELHGKTLAILGLGRIGTLVAQRASSFGMRILAYDPYVAEERATRIGVELADLETVLASADFVAVHLPRTRETEGLVDAAALRMMKPGVRIVNVARGGIVDEAALADALASGHVAGAAVDVFAVEPTTDSPLFALPNVVVTPHLGASTREAQDKAGLAVAEAVAAALRGELVPSAVNLDIGAPVTDVVRSYLPLAEQLGTIFTTFARGLPSMLTVTAMGRLGREVTMRPLGLAALKGALQATTEEPVTYVNVGRVAAARGVAIREAATGEVEDYQSVLSLTGEVAGSQYSISGSIRARKGNVLTEVNGYEIEFPLCRYMLLVRNDDSPGMIGTVGTLIGNAGVNIADMAVGRHRGLSRAMMGLSLDHPVTPELQDALLAQPGIVALRFIELS